MADLKGKKREVKLGDKVEKVAKPIAKAIDYIAGTNIQNCGGCKKRKEALNKLFSGET
jgi:7-cyano-7-deazaguanine synthase in queuosine biosynthesis